MINLVCLKQRTERLDIEKPDAGSTLINDIFYYINEKGSDNINTVVTSQRGVSISNNSVLVREKLGSKYMSISPKNTLLFIESSKELPFGRYLMFKGFKADTYKPAYMFASQRISALLHLKDMGFPVQDIAVNMQPANASSFLIEKGFANPKEKLIATTNAEVTEELKKNFYVICRRNPYYKYQADYRVLVYLGVPITGALRISKKIDGLASNLWIDGISLPLTVKTNLKDLKTHSSNSVDYYKSVETRKVCSWEKDRIINTLMQESIRRKKSIVMPSPNIFNKLGKISSTVAKYLRLGRCEVEFVRVGNDYLISGIETRPSHAWSIMHNIPTGKLIADTLLASDLFRDEGND